MGIHCIYKYWHWRNCHVTKHGNSLVLVINQPILELLRIAADKPLNIYERVCPYYFSSLRHRAPEEIPEGPEKGNRFAISL